MKSKFSNTNFFYKIWLAFCILTLLAAISTSVLVYLQVSNHVTNQMKQLLLGEANYYCLQLDDVFVRASQRLDGLAHSSAANSTNYSMLQSEMNALQTELKGIIRCWIAYPNGNLIPAPGTSIEHISKLPWWKDYLSGQASHNLPGLMTGRGLTLVGKPFFHASNGISFVPLLSIESRGTNIVRVVGAELDLNCALSHDGDVNRGWSNLPVSIYTNEGILIASPYLDYRGMLKLTNRPSDNPLIRQMLAHPKDMSGFKVYAINKQKMVGYYLKNPSLGLVLVVEQPAATIVDPVRQIAFGPLVVALFVLLITTIIITIIYTDAKRLRRAEQLTRSAELRALQAQINPHFLFNTLDQMVNLAVSSNPSALTKAIKTLANLFRYTTRQIEELVTLQEELNYLKEYISLQQIRYGNRFSFQLQAPESLMKMKILKFSIQPLVENCFVHGIEKTLCSITIKVHIEQIGDEINIHVIDNGPGILVDRLSEITKRLNEESYESSNRNHSVGLSNIHHRLRYIYGHSYGVSLERLEPGLAVHLKFPLRTSETKVR